MRRWFLLKGNKVQSDKRKSNHFEKLINSRIKSCRRKSSIKLKNDVILPDTYVKIFFLFVKIFWEVKGRFVEAI